MRLEELAFRPSHRTARHRDPLARENPRWGVPRIQSELALLGHIVSETTVSKYRVRHRKPPSQIWRTFLDNHVQDIVAVDFFNIPTATFRMLFAFVVLRHDRRHVVHFNVTAHPTAEWTAQQMIEAFPDETAPRFLLATDFQNLYKYAAVGLSLFTLLFVGAVCVLRWRQPGLQRPFCVPGYPFVPVVYRGVTIFMTIFAFQQWPGPSLCSLLTILAGVPV